MSRPICGTPTNVATRVSSRSETFSDHVTFCAIGSRYEAPRSNMVLAGIGAYSATPVGFGGLPSELKSPEFTGNASANRTAPLNDQPVASFTYVAPPEARCLGELDISGLIEPPTCGNTFCPMFEYVAASIQVSSSW